MTLKELQKMIKEEFDAYVSEAEDDVDVSVTDSDVDAEMSGEEGGEGAEDMLRNIYDMLKTKFEAEDEMGDDGDDVDETMYNEEDMEEDMMDEVKGDEKKDEAADMEEASGMGFGDPGNKKTSGKDVGFTPAKKTSGGTGYDAGSKALQERFQKLANIIK